MPPASIFHYSSIHLLRPSLTHTQSTVSSYTHTQHNHRLHTHTTRTPPNTQSRMGTCVCVGWELGGVLWRSSLQGSGRPGGVGCQPCFVFLMVERCCLMVERCFQYLPGGGEGRWDVGSLTKFSAFGFLRAPRMLTNPGHTH